MFLKSVNRGNSNTDLKAESSMIRSLVAPTPSIVKGDIVYWSNQVPLFGVGLDMQDWQRAYQKEEASNESRRQE